MNEFDKKRAENKKRYDNFAELYYALELLESKSIEGGNLGEALKLVQDHCKNGYSYALPSGKVGNALAVALETHHFISAEYIIHFHVNKEKTIIMGNDNSTINEVFEDVLKYCNFDEELERIDFIKMLNYGGYLKRKNRYEEELAAIEKIKDTLKEKVKIKTK